MLGNNIFSKHELTIDNTTITQNAIMALLKLDVVIVDSVYITLNLFMINASNFQYRNSSLISLLKSTIHGLQYLTFSLPQSSIINFAVSQISFSWSLLQCCSIFYNTPSIHHCYQNALKAKFSFGHKIESEFHVTDLRDFRSQYTNFRKRCISYNTETLWVRTTFRDAKLLSQSVNSIQLSPENFPYKLRTISCSFWE